MTTLREAAQQALEALGQSETTVRYEGFGMAHREAERKHQAAIAALRAALAEPERRLTDEIIAELWYKNGTYHHHFARAIERWLKGGQ